MSASREQPPESASPAVPRRRPSRAVEIPALDLGCAPYSELQKLQARLRRRVAEGEIPGVLLLLEHPAVITLGRRGGEADLLEPPPPGVDLVRSERGGAATVHAPGQLVAYPIVPLPGRDLRAFVRGLEEVLIRLLAGYGITAVRRDGHPGLYVETGGRSRGGVRPYAKIASVGLRCERWVASHGTSLNVSPDLSLFELIVSCAEPGLTQTSMAVLLEAPPPLSEVKQRYVTEFAGVLPFALAPLRAVAWEVVDAELRRV